jgi:hypothetical protein
VRSAGTVEHLIIRTRAARQFESVDPRQACRNSISTAGVYSMTVSGAAQAASATDRIYIEFVFHNNH